MLFAGHDVYVNTNEAMISKIPAKYVSIFSLILSVKLKYTMDEGMLKNGAILGKQIAGGDIPTKKKILVDILHYISTEPTTLHQAFLCDIHKSLIPCFLVPNENCKLLSLQIITKYTHKQAHQGLQ